MNILGIIMATNSTAALLRDGEIVACASEERFNRKKNTFDYPRHAIDYCLLAGGIAAGDLDEVALVGAPFPYIYWVTDKQVTFSVQDKLSEQYLYWKPKLLEGRRVKYLDIFKEKIISARFGPEARRQYYGTDNEFAIDPRFDLVRDHLKVSPRIVRKYNHHLSHIYYGLYGGPFQDRDCLVLAVEGWGDTANASVSVFRSGRLRIVSSSRNFLLGRLYRYMTLLLGMNYDDHEYKVMGLAAYASPEVYRKAYDVFRETMYVDGLKFRYRVKPTDTFFWFKERLEGVRFDWIAGGLQKYLEDVLCTWTQNAIRATGIRNIVFSGGVAMNCKALMEVAKLPEVEGLHVCPTPSDESLAMGVAYLAAKRHGVAQLKPLANAYLGPEYSKAYVRQFLTRKQVRHRYRVQEGVTPRQVAQLLASGEIIGVLLGRMEFGARALGNRSILARPTDTSIVRTLNRKIKRRDFWMPFAPVILKEREQDYLINPKNIRHDYMTVASETTALAQKELIAALHPADLTARPQVIERHLNPEYYDLIKEFEAITGVGGLLNTSFNLHGEPIVLSPEDALDVFARSGLEHVLINDVLISKDGAESP